VAGRIEMAESKKRTVEIGITTQSASIRFCDVPAEKLWFRFCGSVFVVAFWRLHLRIRITNKDKEKSSGIGIGPPCCWECLRGRHLKVLRRWLSCHFLIQRM
jgi:hypothetical protein